MRFHEVCTSWLPGHGISQRARYILWGNISLTVSACRSKSISYIKAVHHLKHSLYFFHIFSISFYSLIFMAFCLLLEYFHIFPFFFFFFLLAFLSSFLRFIAAFFILYVFFFFPQFFLVRRFPRSCVRRTLFIFPFRLFQFYSLYHLHSLPIYFFTFCFHPFPFLAIFCACLFTLKTSASSSFTNRKSNLAYRGPHSARIFQRLIFYTDLPRYKGNITFSWQESDLWISLYVPSNARERNVLCFLIAMNGKAKSLSKMDSTLKGESFNPFDLPFLNG